MVQKPGQYSQPIGQIPRASFWEKNQRVVAPWLFLMPAMLVFAAYVIFPILQSIRISFYEWDGLGPMTEFVGLDNYRQMLDDPEFHTSIVNNVTWLVLFMLAPPMGLAIALFLNQKVFGIRLIKSLFFFPFVISQVVIGAVFSWFYDPSFGLLAKILELVGLPAIPVLSDETVVTYGIIAAGLWPQVAYCMILYLTGLNNVNPELLEAGSLDGAKGWTMLRHIVLPQLRPATFIAIVVTVIGALRSFDLVASMTSGGPYGTSRVLAYYMYEQAIFNHRMGYGAALATILFLIMLVYIAWFLYRMMQQEKRGGE
jgi:multiple sugar transport system permease protein